MSAKKEYDMLLDLGELKELYPNLYGVWEKDNKRFTSIWEQNQEILGGIEVEDYEEL